MLLSETVRGMRDAAFPVFLSIVLFKFIENEAYIGLNTMICGLASAVSFYFAGRLIKENNRVRCVLISSGVLFILYLAVFLRVNATVIFILSVANSMLATYILNPSMAALFSMFKDVGEDANFPQLMAAHEMFLAVGRVIGFIVIIVLSYNTGVYVYAFLLLNLSAFLGALLLKLAENAHKRERMAALKQ
jgi:YQGE family putative transporter